MNKFYTSKNRAQDSSRFLNLNNQSHDLQSNRSGHFKKLAAFPQSTKNQNSSSFHPMSETFDKSSQRPPSSKSLRGQKNVNISLNIH